MLYYTSLFLIVLLASVIIVWLYRAIFGVGRTGYRSSVRGGRTVSKRTKARMQAHRAAHPVSPHVIDGPVSLRGHARAGENMFAATHTPGAAGANAGWPYKEEKMESVGKAYRVNRKAATKSNADKDGKPWGW